jgi:hypothetical protein
MLETISSDRYWSRVPVDERCIHILASDGEANIRRNSPAQKCVKPGTGSCAMPRGGSSIKKRDDSGSSSRSDTPSRMVKPMKRKNKVKKKRAKSKAKKVLKVEEIIISSSEPLSDSSCPEPVSSASDNSDCEDPPMPDALRRQWQRYADNCKVVTPPKFSANGKVSLKEFFTTFENYFEKKFSGTTYDQTQKLADFLDGDLLTVYHVRGGRKLKYREMKCQLLDYHKSHKVGGKRYWRQEFAKASPNFDESWDIFGLRLVELAELAYHK